VIVFEVSCVKSRVAYKLYMKKILLFIITILAAGTVNAQRFFSYSRSDYDDFYQKQSGFEINANISSIVTSNAPDYNTHHISGFSAGYNLNLPVYDPLSIKIGILYSQKGYAANIPYGNFTQHNHYVDIPVLAKFKKGRLSLYVGPQISYLITSSTSFDSGFSDDVDHYNYTGKKLFYDAVTGLSFNFDRTIDIHVRYAIDIGGKSINGNTYIPYYRNQVVQAGIGFTIN